ncbi:MAG: 2-hydroxyacyl-CoA dehydratase [Deltaproteobacteria bacterium]|nr:2-hydroxyacyl-CoA dehydratase [Deltaproteobacteria bacterium]
MEAIRHIRSLLASRLSALNQEKLKGKKIIGYIPGGYFPEELVLAAGAVPVCMIRGGDHSAVETAIAYVDRWLDTFYRAQIGYGVSGVDPYYKVLDALFVPITDANNRALSDVLAYHTPLDVFPFGIPHTKSEDGYGYYLHGLTKVKAKLEQITGNDITDERLAKAIEQCNRERELLKEISLMRKSDNPPIASKDFVMINHASMIVEKTTMIENLDSLVRELRNAKPGVHDRPRLMLTGSTLAMGDHKIVELIESAGGNVVVEDFAEGIKPYWNTVPENDAPLNALAKTYFMDRVAPAWFRPGSERLDYLIRLARDYSVNGVVWYHLMYRESYKMQSYYFPEMLRKETGLTMLTLESDYDPAETGQMSTRIETYIESIRRQP